MRHCQYCIDLMGYRDDAYLHFGDNFGFCGIDVTTVDHADDVGLGALQERYGRPQNAFTAAACITRL